MNPSFLAKKIFTQSPSEPYLRPFLQTPKENGNDLLTTTTGFSQPRILPIQLYNKMLSRHMPSESFRLVLMIIIKLFRSLTQKSNLTSLVVFPKISLSVVLTGRKYIACIRNTSMVSGSQFHWFLLNFERYQISATTSNQSTIPSFTLLPVPRIRPHPVLLQTDSTLYKMQSWTHFYANVAVNISLAVNSGKTPFQTKTK